MFMLSNRLYDFTKRLVQVILPAVSALYFGLAGIWDLPAAEKVVGTIAIITTFLGVSLGISHTAYRASDKPYDGSLNVTEHEDGEKKFLLELDASPEELEDKKSITFRVKRKTPLVAEPEK